MNRELKIPEARAAIDKGQNIDRKNYKTAVHLVARFLPER
jgi:hypothetical protein